MMREQVISDDQIGSCEIPFRNIIETGFPVMKAYSLFDHRDNKVGNLMLSFDWCDDFPADRLLSRKHLERSAGCHSFFRCWYGVFRGGVLASRRP